MAQFVPVKLDTSTDQWRTWEREHPSEGNGIPKIYVVRADGETLYAKSGSLRGDALPKMMVEALSRTGYVLSDKDIQTLTATADQAEELKAEGDVSAAIKSLSRLKKYGGAGQIESYAASANRLNQMVGEWVKEADDKIRSLAKQMEGGNAAQQLQASLSFYQLKRDYLKLTPLKPALTRFQKEYINHRDYRELTSQARTIDTARNAKSKSARTRSIGKLNELISETNSPEVKKLAEEVIEQLKTAEIDSL